MQWRNCDDVTPLLFVAFFYARSLPISFPEHARSQVKGGHRVFTKRTYNL
jgi:hypothetical protein